MQRFLLSVLLIAAPTVVSAGLGSAALDPFQAARALARRTTRIKLFFIALNDRGKTGKQIGCDDSLVAVERSVPPTNAPLTSAITELLSMRDRTYGQSGLYNALAQSQLKVERVALVDGAVEIRLAGTITLGGTCDGPRFDQQIRETALQFRNVKSVAVFVNGVPLEKTLSGK